MNRPHLKETSRQCYLENQEIVSSGQTEKKTPEKTPGVEMKNCGNSWSTLGSLAQNRIRSRRDIVDGPSSRRSYVQPY